MWIMWQTHCLYFKEMTEIGPANDPNNNIFFAFFVNIQTILSLDINKLDWTNLINHIKYEWLKIIKYSWQYYEENCQLSLKAIILNQLKEMLVFNAYYNMIYYHKSLKYNIIRLIRLRIIMLSRHLKSFTYCYRFGKLNVQ